MEVEPTLLQEADTSSADSLVSSNDPDDMANEQTWPTEEEMRNPGEAHGEALPDASSGTTPKVVKRVPKGTSEYQAAWIVDESDEEGDDGQDDGSESGIKDPAEVHMEDSMAAEHEEQVEVEMESRKSVTFEDLDMEEETKQ